MIIKTKFTKPYACSSDRVALLRSRGLEIANAEKAESYLNNIGYYRLSAYMYPLLQTPKERHLYKQGATFEKVMMLYRFDKKLRLLAFNEIEKIEVAVRSVIVDAGCQITGNPFWLTDGSNFINTGKFNQTIKLTDDELRRSREDFIVHFKDTYSNPYPPAWILAEILPFGVITNIFNNIKNKRIKKKVSQRFGLQVAPFESWLTIITLTRNSCCHHARIWNKQNTIRPMLPNHIGYPWIALQTDTLRIYFDLCIIKYFLNIISPQNNMTDKLKTLLATFPEIDISAMGFPQMWDNESVWKGVGK